MKYDNFNLQLFAEGEGGATVETITWFDPTEKKEISLPAKIGEFDTKVLMGKLNSGIRNSIKSELEGKYGKEVNELKTLLNDKNASLEQIQAKYQEIEDQKLSADERIKKQYDGQLSKLSKELEAERAKTNQYLNKFQSKQIETDLYTALSGHKLNNPDQTKALVAMYGKAEIRETEKGEITVLKMEIDGSEQELTPKEYVDRFLALPENAHHLTNNLQPGAGSRQGGQRSTNGTLQYRKDDIASNPEVRKEYMEKLKNGEAVALV